MTFREGFLPFYHGQAYSPQVFGSEKIPAIAHLWTQSKTSFIEQPSYAPHQSLRHPIGRPETGSQCSKDCQKSLSSYILPRTSGPPTTLPISKLAAFSCKIVRDGVTSSESILSKCELLNSYFMAILTQSSETVPTSPLRNIPPPLTLSGVSYTEEEALHLLWNRSVL